MAAGSKPSDYEKPLFAVSTCLYGAYGRGPGKPPPSDSDYIFGRSVLGFVGKQAKDDWVSEGRDGDHPGPILRGLEALRNAGKDQRL